ncbi:GlxA family transcriptional regulator [Agarilytica rhodophyticola]|uniref:GlxA family transcriptional regulator n=1 Tax=Agarilytica rhodophyticola TaxID=1737490 RepID=UPI000B345867|nr:helix-turn-helix domain-containing protein [Agarilytica rhodophyticola]
MRHIAILTYDGFSTFEFGCAIELFLLARPDIPKWYTGQVVTFASSPLRATGGISVEAIHIRDLHTFDMLIIPSWPTTTNTLLTDTQKNSIYQFVRQGHRVISFCSGAFLLAELGLLDGRRAITHWQYEEIFKQRFPNVHYVDNVLYLYDNNLGCSAGSAAAIDLGMEVIRQDFGYEVANKVARRMVMPPHRTGGQSQFVGTPVNKNPSSFAKTLDWATQQLSNDVTVEDMATKANMSRRSFDRHFRNALDMSPLQWLVQQKLKCAQQLLESSQKPIEIIALESGFKNALTLRHNFNKCLGITPTQYRQQFSFNASKQK